MTNCSGSGLKFQNNSGVPVRDFIESFEYVLLTKVYISNCHAFGNTNVYDGFPAQALAVFGEGFDVYASKCNSRRLHIQRT